MQEKKVILIGGYGNRCNSGRQYHQQNRVYDSKGVAMSITASFAPWYLVYGKKKMHNNDRRKK